MTEDELNFQIFVSNCFGQQGIGQFTMQGAPCGSEEEGSGGNEGEGSGESEGEEETEPTPTGEGSGGSEGEEGGSGGSEGEEGGSGGSEGEGSESEQEATFEEENPRDENNEELVEQWVDDYTCADKEPSAETKSWLTQVGAITPVPFEGNSWPECCVAYEWAKSYITPTPESAPLPGETPTPVTPKKYATDPETGQQYQWVSTENINYDNTLQCLLRDEKNVFRLDLSGDYLVNRVSHLFSSYKGMCDGEYEVEIPEEMPIGFLADSPSHFNVQNTPIPVTPTVTVTGITEYYSGNFKIDITGNFGRAFYASAAHGYKNGNAIKGGAGSDSLGAIKYNCQTCGEPTPTPTQ